MRDMAGDAASSVRTIPVILGRERTLLILSLIDVAIATLSPIIAIIGAVLIWYFRKERPNIAYDLLVDGWELVGGQDSQGLIPTGLKSIRLN